MTNSTLLYPPTYRLAALLLVLSVLSGCQKPEQNASANKSDPKATSSVMTTTASSTTSGVASGNATTTIDKPVVYPFTTWQNQPITPLALSDITAIKAKLGNVNRSDDKSLDYASNPAIKYSFAADTDPYLDLIDSPQFLEIGWYYANPTDTSKEKQQSTDNAAKAYQITQGLLGKEGGKLVETILKGEVVKNDTLNGKLVTLAKCEFYSCQVIIKK